MCVTKLSKDLYYKSIGKLFFSTTHLIGRLFFCSETTFTLMCVTGRYCRAMNLHTSVTSCWILWWAGKVGWPQHQTSCTFEWIVRAERKAGDSKRLWTAAKSASTPCPAWPFFFSCCWTRCSAAVTSCKPIREVAQLENVNYGEYLVETCRSGAEPRLYQRSSACHCWAGNYSAPERPKPGRRWRNPDR